ncbi:MAG: SDR family oxidoreductase [Solirubrobacterales bacterium]
MNGGRMQDRVTVVTGAAGGFGRATSERVLEEGGAVGLWDLDGERLQRTATELAKLGPVHAVVVDVGDSAVVDAAAAETRAQLGPIDSLLNNAGYVVGTPPWEVTDEEWEKHFQVNADGAFWCVRACLPDMRERGYGKIVSIASQAALQGRPTTSPAYAASKGAILGMTVSLARNLGECGICVNAINPGFIRTEIHDQFSDQQIAELKADVPLHRDGVKGKGLPVDIANAVLFLLSRESDYVSGEFLNVNGASRTG